MRSAAGVALLSLIAVSAAAQARPESLLQPGQRVRYGIPRASSDFTGVVAHVDTLGFSVRPEGTDLLVRLGFDSLQSLAVFDGLRSPAEGARRGAGSGLRLGLMVGAVLTTAVWLSSADERCDACFFPPTIAMAQLSVLGTLVLSLLGGALGASAPGERWTEIPLRTSGTVNLRGCGGDGRPVNVASRFTV
jgi:hypothetical protein